MAALIFMTKPGVAVRLSEPTVASLFLSIGGAAGAIDSASSFSTHKSIITEMSVNRAGNYQFLHSLQDLIYVYVFGERISDIRVSGISFASTCQSGTAAGGVTGIEHLLEYYEQSRISATGRPYQILIGTSGQGRASGFLTGMNVSIDRPEARMARFTLSFKAFKQ
jgi:hypothetical protein